MDKTTLEDHLILSVIKTVRRVVRVLPYRASLAIGSVVGELAYRFTKRRRVMRKNLRAVFAGEKTEAELSRIARESFRNLGRVGIELMHVPEMDRAFVDRHVRVIGREKVDAALKEGKGIIFLTAHFGSWEMLNIASSILGYPMVALARVQKHPKSDAYLNDLRRSKGSEVIYKGMPVREILRALKGGRIVGILSDQDGGRNGAFVPFFGRMSSYPKGVAAFALRTGAPILPAFIFRENIVNHRIEVEGPLVFPEGDLSEEEKEKHILRQFAELLEGKVRKDPTQWLWAHRRWKSTPDRFVLVLSDGKAGHRNQSLALAEAIVRQRQAKGAPVSATHVRTIEVEFRGDFSRGLHRLVYRVFGGRVPAADFWARKCLKPECYREIMKAYADVVVSAGSSVAGVNLWCSAVNGARPVTIMNPGFGLGSFEAVVAPRHDRLSKRSNVFETRGALSRESAEKMADEARALCEELGLAAASPRVGLLVGGDTRQTVFEEKGFAAAVDEVARAASAAGCQVLATTSRRTPSWGDAAMRRFFGDRGLCPLLVVANEKNRPGAVSAILGASTVVVVTGESISMVSEAVASGRKVFVIEPFEGGRMRRKQKEFLKEMESDGMIERVSAGTIGDRLRAELAQGTFSSASSGGDADVLRRAAERVSS